MLERLADVCEEQGRKGEAVELRKEAKRGGVATRITKQKIGRNEPTRAGAGKGTRGAAAPETCPPWDRLLSLNDPSQFLVVMIQTVHPRTQAEIIALGAWLNMP